MSVHVCVPVLKRYDLLRDLLHSLRSSELKPDTVFIINNGRDAERLSLAIAQPPVALEIITPNPKLGVADSWNWFIQNVDEERIIVNDDITFAPQSLSCMVNASGGFVSALAGTNACSCFLIRDSCVKKVGLFDEAISPGYGYFEDCDYVERMLLLDEYITAVDCGVTHKGSQTIAENSPHEWFEHHRRFELAQNNFIRKWGRMPNVGPERSIRKHV